ncbi:uncharacterized protein Z518_02303 [Rhinocladiella mackenziei CBS 650.93]|uniref:Uncharacterized protein n=1 Tax=Rhinocladiella mackenziei CBS 650.93 TaxID=1442369 RepID=A0A0D2JEN4_9EURO|nr:uncharacterized protein Z518_02303 [Rhinocladiella mackenziei CBS 650.93]KIX07650.1 hypothetical protein Z518_02303 [Rhinocladiella mackenziei CBS 650.93]
MPPPKPSLNELMQTVKANVKKYRAERPSLLKPTTSMLKMDEPEIESSSRAADQEVDTVEICPEHPEYMIIGTYSLVKKGEPCDYEGQSRRGTLQVMTVASNPRPKYAGMLPPQLDKVAFSCAVLDIHFHPTDRSLLGVATSNAEMHFFRFIIHGDVLGRRTITKLLLLGTITVAENDEHGLVPLVTQFTWFPEIRTRGVSGISDMEDISFAATTSFGDVKVIKTSIPAIKVLFDDRLSQPSDPIPVISTDIHKHDLEAWTVTTITLNSSESKSNANHCMILSGGDDSALIASAVGLPRITSQPNSPSISPSDIPDIIVQPLWKDRRSHTAGVVSILPLLFPNNSGLDTEHETISFVTGSYDEYLRVFELDAKTLRAHFKTELRLNGGVWRLKILDQYDTTSETSVTASTGPSPNTIYQSGTRMERHQNTLILASLMHAGAAVLRLTYSSPFDSSQGTWTITLVKTFRTGHESMVYCCDARRDTGNEALSQKESTPTYTVVSTSFYDMKICAWTFADQFKGQIPAPR